MPRHSIADDTELLHDLIDKTLAGDEVVITRDGKPVAELRPVRPSLEARRHGLDQLRAFREARPPSPVSSVELLRQMYEDDL